jgi:tetratricopeptide (TPR) repeat protein
MLRQHQRHIPLLIGAALVLALSLTVQAQINPFDIDKNRDDEKSAQSSFRRALNQYRDGNYWASSHDMVTLLDRYPHFSRADETYFTLGNCLNELGMQNGAARMYEHILRKHIYSTYVPHALLGLQRVNYEKDALSESLTYYTAAMRGNPSREIIDLANYYAGITYYKLGDYPKSIVALSDVSNKSPYYDYVLYNLAKSLLRMQRVNQAVDVFHKIFDLPIINDERRRVVNEAHLSLGYLYYELGYSDQGIEQFNKVAPGSDKHPAALLASGWAATQNKEWDRAITPLTALYSTYETNDETQEGLFLLGRSYLKLNRFDEAIKIYDHLINLFQDSSDVITTVKQVNADVERERKKIKDRETQLVDLERNLINDMNLNGVGEKSFTAEQTGVMKNIQQERKELATRLTQLDRLATATAIKEERRNWRAYAEYGKIRASFLKRRQRRQKPPTGEE